MGSFIAGIFRSIMFFFDQIIFSFIPIVYNFIMDLARIKLFDVEAIKAIATNVYGILGLFLIFRIAFILLNAIVDPDKLTSKEEGIAKIFGRVIVSLVLIAAIPWAFTVAFDLQKSILENSVIEKLILGRANNTSDQASNNSGQYLGYLSLRSFISCNEGADTTSCSNLETYFSNAFPQGTGSGTKSGDFSSLSDNLNTSIVLNGKSTFAYDYKAGLSTICGGVILFMLITFCFDIAVRTIKLGFLQMISPIAVVGYIEPKSAIFKNWLKMCISTYVNLFVRIIAISFVAFALSSLSNSLGVIYGPKLEGSTKMFAQIFILLGLLIFAKEVPNMLASLIPGMKESGLGSLNPLKKLGAVPFIGGAAAAGIGAATGLAGKGIAGSAGALRGGLNSKFRGGSFLAGASKGAGVAAKNVPLKGGLKKQMSGMFTSGRKAADAGATSATGVETHTGLGNTIKEKSGEFISSREEQARIQHAAAEQSRFTAEYTRNGSDIANLLKNGNFKKQYTDLKTDKTTLNTMKAKYDKDIADFAQLKNRQSTVLANRDSTQEKLNALTSAGVTSGAEFDKAKTDLEAYKNLLTTIDSNVATQQVALDSYKNGLDAQDKKVAVAKNAFDESKKLANNKADAETLAYYEKLKDKGAI